MRYRALVPAALALAACAAPAPSHATISSPSAPDPGVAAWDALKRELPGTWTMAGKNGPFTVTYKVISGGSVLVEAWGPGTKSETATLFAPDHASLMLTHYCGQGNQPRLRVASMSDGAIVFRFVDVTNKDADQAMLVERTLRVSGDTFDDTEIYRRPDGSNETSNYHFVRSK